MRGVMVNFTQQLLLFSFKGWQGIFFKRLPLSSADIMNANRKTVQCVVLQFV